MVEPQTFGQGQNLMAPDKMSQPHREIKNKKNKCDSEELTKQVGRLALLR